MEWFLKGFLLKNHIELPKYVRNHAESIGSSVFDFWTHFCPAVKPPHESLARTAPSLPRTVPMPISVGPRYRTSKRLTVKWKVIGFFSLNFPETYVTDHVYTNNPIWIKMYSQLPFWLKKLKTFGDPTPLKSKYQF